MKELLQSFMSLPLWVRLWMLLLLIPVNLSGLFVWDYQVGKWIAILGISGMLPNLYVMYNERAFSKTMAVSHIIPWTILVIYLAVKLFRGEVPEGAIFYLSCAVLVINSISLIFDYKESYEWYQERQERT